MIKVFYIMHPKTMLMSNGAMPPIFVEHGRIWLTKEEVHNHVDFVDDMYGHDIYDGCVIFEGEIKNTGMCVL